jgi:hypothetical protein
MARDRSGLTAVEIRDLLSDEDDDDLSDLSIDQEEEEEEEDQQAMEIPDLVEAVIERIGTPPPLEDDHITLTPPPNDDIPFIPSPGSQDMFLPLPPSPQPPPAKRLRVMLNRLPLEPAEVSGR